MFFLSTHHSSRLHSCVTAAAKPSGPSTGAEFQPLLQLGYQLKPKANTLMLEMLLRQKKWVRKG